MAVMPSRLPIEPRVSIIIPAFNAATHIEAAIASVEVQTLNDWELLIVNDGSTDRTGEILDTIQNSRIRVFHQANAGVGAARNRGLDAVQGRYITFLDADDALPSNALEVRAAYLDRHPEIDIANGAVRVMSGQKTIRTYSPDCTQGSLLERLARLDQGVFFGVCHMLRRAKIGAARFPEGRSHCEDIMFFLALAHDEGLHYGAVEDVVYEYRVRPGSAMSDLDGLEAGYLDLLRFSAKLGGLDNETLRYQARRVGRILFRSWLRRLRPLRALVALGKVRRTMMASRN